MKVRIRLSPNKEWTVESQRWWSFGWEYERSFFGDDSYERAQEYARILKNNYTEEIE